MPRSVVYILLIAVFLVTACKKDQVKPANNPNYPTNPNEPGNPTGTAFLGLLPGQWQWIGQPLAEHGCRYAVDVEYADRQHV
jgi:hypothetical protein